MIWEYTTFLIVWHRTNFFKKISSSWIIMDQIQVFEYEESIKRIFSAKCNVLTRLHFQAMRREWKIQSGAGYFWRRLSDVSNTKDPVGTEMRVENTTRSGLTNFKWCFKRELNHISIHWGYTTLPSDELWGGWKCDQTLSSEFDISPH